MLHVYGGDQLQVKSNDGGQSMCTSDYFLCNQIVALQQCHPLIGSAVYSAKDARCEVSYCDTSVRSHAHTQTRAQTHAESRIADFHST